MRRLEKKKAFLVFGLVTLVYFVAGRHMYRSFQKNDELASTLFNHAEKLRLRGDLLGFETNMLKAIDVSESDNPHLFQALGNHYLRSHQYEKALKYYKKFINATPQFQGSILNSMANAYAELGYNDRAIELLEKLREHYPSQFRSESLEFLLALQNAKSKKTSVGYKTAVLQFIPKKKLKQESYVHLSGNWTPSGLQSDAYGWSEMWMERRPNGIFERKVELKETTDFPYQAVVRDNQHRFIGFKRFRFEPDGENTQIFRIEAPENYPLSPLLVKKSKLQMPNMKADGHERFFILWLDSGSWWFIRSLIERNYLPNFEDVIEHSTSAMMISDPPWTAVALPRLTSFSQNIDSWNSFLLKFRGLGFIERLINVDVSKDNTLASRVRQAGYEFVSLTFNEAYENSITDESEKYGFRAGEYLENKFDPSKRELAPNSSVLKYLNLSRVHRFQDHGDDFARWVLATQWDDNEKKLNVAEKIWNSHEKPDVLFLRLPAVDILAHAFFDNTVAVTENNMFLEAFYVYLDSRLGQWRTFMDQDDTLIIVSDHGPLNHYQHQEEALFIVQGPNALPGEKLKAFPIQKFPSIAYSLIARKRMPAEFLPPSKQHESGIKNLLRKLQLKKAPTTHP